MKRLPRARRVVALGWVFTVVVLLVFAPIAGGVGSFDWDEPAATLPDAGSSSADTTEGLRSGDRLSEPSQPVHARPAAAVDASPDRNREPATLRLLTGEAVAVTGDDGDASYEPVADSSLHYVETPSSTYLFPATVDLTTYDRSLFDVGALREMGLTGGDAIPVLLETDAPPVALDGPGLRDVRALPSADVVAAEVEPGPGTSTIEALVTDGTVTRVSLDGPVESTPRQAPAAAPAPTHTNLTGDGVRVAVLDSGIDSTHPALAGRVVDRVDLVNGDESSLDRHGHGTHVAGILAGSESADGEHAGIAPGTSLVDVRVIDEHGNGRTSTVIEGVEYAVEEADVDMILMSLGSSFDGSRALAQTVEWAADRGVIVVAAGGNNGYPRSIGAPGRPAGVITVGATDGAGRIAPYSARGPTLEGHLKPELVAPGHRIVGPASAASDRVTVDDAGRYTWITGTSASTAQVAGAAALLLEAEPGLTAREIENRLASTARPVEGAGTYAQGGGELAVERALDPDVVAQDAVVDFGLVETNETRTRTITFENRDDRRHELSFELTVTNHDLDEAADGVARLNRTALSLAPDERETIALTINGSATPGAHAGTLRYSVGGQPRTVAFGFVRGGTVTVEKQALTADSTVEGDPLWVFTEERTHDEVLEFENGTASFVAGGGTYVLWSSGTDEATGATVLLSDRRRFSGPTAVVLDERETVPVGVDASPIVERYGRLANLSVVASMSAPAVEGIPKLSIAKRDAASRQVRISPDPAADVATTFLLAPENGRQAPLDVSDVFHLVHSQRGVSGPSVVHADPEELATTEHRYHRTAVDETYRLQDRAAVAGVWNYRPLQWFDLGGRETQRVHRLSAAATYTRSIDGADWRARRTVGDEPTASTDVIAHPLFGLVESLTIADGNATLTGIPFWDGQGTTVDQVGAHTLTISVNGERVDERPITRGSATVDGVGLAPGDDLTVRLVGNNSEGRLSTATVTEVGVSSYDPEAGIDAAVANHPPIVRNVEIEDADRFNAVEPGEVTVSYDVDRIRALVNPRIWYATSAPGEPAWENRSGWHRAETRRFGGQLVATFDVPETAETVSLAAELRTIRGHYARTMTTDAFYVDEAPNTSTSMLEGRLVTENGTPTGNATVVVEPVDGGSRKFIETDEDGRFSAELVRDRPYDLAFVNGEPWAPRASVGADRPAWNALTRVHLGDDVDLGNWTLPRGHPLEIRVDDQRGEPVSNATVRITHHAGDGTASLTGVLPTTQAGWAVANRTDGPGVGLAGELEIEIEPPDDALYPEQTHRINVTNRGPTVRNVTLETAPPDAVLIAGGRFQPGYEVTLTARKSSVPAGVAEYRWDLDGDGTPDRVTDAGNATIRYDPEEWGREPILTVVDEAGKTDTSQVLIPEREPRQTPGESD